MVGGQSHTLILYFEVQTQKELTQQDLSNAKFRRASISNVRAATKMPSLKAARRSML
jgi:hypothetical protein